MGDKMGLQDLVTPRGHVNQPTRPASVPVRHFIFPEHFDDKLKKQGLTIEEALVNDFFIKTAVRNLSQQNPFRNDYIRFLQGVNPRFSAHYLAGALRDPDCGEGVATVLSKYPPRDYVVRPVVASLHNCAQSNV